MNCSRSCIMSLAGSWCPQWRPGPVLHSLFWPSLLSGSEQLVKSQLLWCGRNKVPVSLVSTCFLASWGNTNSMPLVTWLQQFGHQCWRCIQGHITGENQMRNVLCFFFVGSPSGETQAERSHQSGRGSLKALSDADLNNWFQSLSDRIKSRVLISLTWGTLFHISAYLQVHGFIK